VEIVQYVKLPKENLEAFVEDLKAYGSVYGPVKIGEFYSFQEIKNSNEMSLDYTRTMIPPKKFFLKLKERIFTFDEKKGEYEEILEEGRIVVFGVHPCDINALKLMDKIYIDESPDKYYRMRRENAVIIGYSCHPDEYCFCQSLGTNYATDGFDLFLHELKDGFFVRIGSDKGNIIASESSDLMKDVESSDIDEFRDTERKREEDFTLELNIHGLTDMLALAYESDVWEEYADRCFGCGSCNLVCPTCRCYNVVDHVNLDLKGGERVREWDSCMLRKHGLVAGDLNFRPTRIERLRNRFNCKGSLREDMLNCVGCGRCTVYCPSKIDYVEVLKKVRGEL
jgi:sulfhydrogenase subunit beta (sulfur reductase)